MRREKTNSYGLGIISLFVLFLTVFPACNLERVGVITPVPTPVFSSSPEPSITPTPSVSPTLVPSPVSSPTIAPLPVTSPTVSPTPKPSSSPTPVLSEIFSVFFSQVDKSLVSEGELNIDQQLSEKISQAKTTIDAALFELDSDLVASSFLEAKKRGVQIRVVTDSDYLEEEALKKIKENGIEVVDDQRSALMHNKFIIIDQKYVWTGSFNTTENDANKNNNNAILINSPELAENYTSEFSEMFEKKQFGATSPTEIIHEKIGLADGSEISSFFAPENKPDLAVIEEIKKAKKNIYFLAFSFTHDEIGQAMISRFKNGVEVKGVFEKRGANTVYSEYPGMLKEGMSVKMDTNTYNLHHKVILIDGNTLLTGSFNFSESASSKNDENLLIIKNNTKLVDAYLSEFNYLYARGEN